MCAYADVTGFRASKALPCTSKPCNHEMNHVYSHSTELEMAHGDCLGKGHQVRSDLGHWLKVMLSPLSTVPGNVSYLNALHTRIALR